MNPLDQVGQFVQSKLRRFKQDVTQNVPKIAQNVGQQIYNTPIASFAQYIPGGGGIANLSRIAQQKNIPQPRIGPYIENKIIKPGINTGVQTFNTVNPFNNATPQQRVISGVNAGLSGLQTVFNTIAPVATLGYSEWEGAKNALSKGKKGGDVAKAFQKGFEGSESVGLGTAAFNNPTLQKTVDIAEFAAPFLQGGYSALQKGKLRVKGAVGRTPTVLDPEDSGYYYRAIDILQKEKKNPQKVEEAKKVLFNLAERYLSPNERPESASPKAIIKALEEKVNNSNVYYGNSPFMMGMVSKKGKFSEPYKPGDIKKLAKMAGEDVSQVTDYQERFFESYAAKGDKEAQQILDKVRAYKKEVAKAQLSRSNADQLKNGRIIMQDGRAVVRDSSKPFIAEPYKDPIPLNENDPFNLFTKEASPLTKEPNLLSPQLAKSPNQILSERNVLQNKLQTPLLKNPSYPDNIPQVSPSASGNLTAAETRKKLGKIMYETREEKVMRGMKKEEPLPWETPEFQKKNPSFGVMADTPEAIRESNTRAAMHDDFIAGLESTAKQYNKKMGIPGKVSLVDYFRTPDHVLEKIGLGNEAKGIRQAWEGYRTDLKTEINRIADWHDQVPDEQSSINIFRYLDGKAGPGTLSPQELKVANEMKAYLSEWADKLNLPKENRVTSYITHIFDADKNVVDEPEFLALLTDKVPGSVYDPFLQKRYGKEGYVENVWRALDAYTKRATRKYNMDPALSEMKRAAEGLDDASYKYVKSYGDRINMRPTDVDTLLDNVIKGAPIGGSMGTRPINRVTQNIRMVIARATLGLNPVSAVRNLTQGINTYAKLGEKYTAVGYFQMMKNWTANGLQELKDQNILDDAMVTDRRFNAVKSFTQRMDDTLFKMFDITEKINRGSAYFGAKAKAIGEGMSEEQAIEYAKKIVRDTQFTFGSVDTPIALSSDLAKTFGQFQTYGLKQTEFLGGMIKRKDFAGLARYIAGTFAATYTIGKLFGMKPTDMIPFFTQGQQFVNSINPLATEEDKMQSPQQQLPPVVQLGKNLLDTTKLLSSDEATKAKGAQAVIDTGAMVLPAGTEAKRLLNTIPSVVQGYSENKNGKIQYLIPKDPVTRLRATVFGKSNLPQAQEYFNNKSSKGYMQPLGKNDSDTAKQMIQSGNSFDQIQNFVTEKKNESQKYFQSRDSAVEKLNPQEQAIFNNMPKQDPEDPLAKQYKYTTLRQYPAIFNAQKEIAISQANGDLSQVDPLYTAPIDVSHAYLTYEAQNPGSKDKKDLFKSNPNIKILMDKRSEYFAVHPIEGQTAGTGAPRPSQRAQQLMNAGMFKDPEVQAYLNANTAYNNSLREKLGLTPIASGGGYSRKPKKGRRIGGGKLRAFKPKKVKFGKKVKMLKLAKLKIPKQPKLKLQT